MEQIIYGDVLFIVNFSMDFLSLFITGKIFHTKQSVFSLTFSAGIGALYGVISIFQSGTPILNFLINIGVSLLMVYIAFGASSILNLIRNTAVMYAIGFLLGGSMTAIFTLLNRGLSGRNIVINGDTRTLYNDIPFSAFIIIALVSVLFSYISGALIKRKAAIIQAEVKIEFAEKTVELKGLCDSGNLLLDPIGASPVVICSYSKMEELLPIGVRPLFRDKKLGILEYANTDFAKKVRIIPVSHVGGSGIIIGLIPDKAFVNGSEKTLCIACSNENEGFGECDCIVPASLL